MGKSRREIRMEKQNTKRALMAAKVMRSVLRLVAKQSDGTTIHRTNSGECVEFGDHYFMIQIYKETAPKVVLMSSVQTGKTEYLIVYTMACVENGLDVFYVLPKYDLRNTFVANRIDTILEDVPRYKKMLRRATSKRSADNKSIKQFAKAVCKFVSSNVRADFKEFPADVQVGDEIDEFDLITYSMAPDRMEASDYKFVRESSNPTIEDHGIHAQFKAGTQNEMHYMCTGCSRWQVLDFFRCVAREIRDDRGVVVDHELREDVAVHNEFVCEECGSELNREQWRWISLHIQGKYPSYHISKMLLRSASPKDLWDSFCQAKAKGETELTRFYNSVLGIPYTAPGSRITDKILKEASLMKWQPYELGKGWSTMGVDVGDHFDVRISIHRDNRRLAVHIGRYKNLEDLHDLIKRYRVRCCVIDAQPETRLVKKFQADAECDVWLCRFKKGEGEASTMIRHDEEKELSIDRTYILDQATAQIRDRTNILPANSDTALDGFYKKSMLANKRILRFDDRGNARYVWTKELNDHQRFADVYDLIAFLVFGGPAEAAPPDEDFEGDMLLRGGFNAKPGMRKFMGVETAAPDEEKEGVGVVDVREESPLGNGIFGRRR